MRNSEINQLVKDIQLEVNNIAQGKVNITVDTTERTPILCGSYDNITGPSTKTESIDRYFDADVFLQFFRQRAKWLNATMQQKQDFTGHPATF